MSPINVHRESRTAFIANHKRRIDILIDGGKRGIGIENKPWAGEQNGQLQDCANNLEKQFGENFLLIRPIGREVDAKSMDEARQETLLAQGKFASWRYATELLAWVDECIQHCQTPRITTFIDEIPRYIMEEFATTTNLRADIERNHLRPALESILKKHPSQLPSAAILARTGEPSVVSDLESCISDEHPI